MILPKSQDGECRRRRSQRRLRLIRGSGSEFRSNSATADLYVTDHNDYGEEVTRCLRLDPKPVFVLFATPLEASSSKNIPFLLLRKEVEENKPPWPPVVAITDIYVFWVKYRT